MTVKLNFEDQMRAGLPICRASRNMATDVSSKIYTLKEQINFIPLRLELLFEGQSIGIATGFHYKRGQKFYLVTNWHVVSGKDPATGKCCDEKTASVPDSIRLGLPKILATGVTGPNGPASTYGWREAVIPLYQNNDRSVPSWFEHPSFRHKVDAVTIPLSFEKLTNAAFFSQ